LDTLATDVLIIGAGASGIRAALAAAEGGAALVLVAKTPVAGSGASFSPISRGWGIQALVGKERTEENLKAFYDDIIRAGLGRCDPKLVRILVEESGVRIEELLRHGLRFKKNPRGDALRVRGCFSNENRAFVTEDFDNVKGTFTAILEKSKAKVLEGRVAELVVADGACWGAWVVSSSTRQIIRIHAKATLVACGGGAGIFTDHLASEHETGDGYALAHRAGARLSNLEFIQFMLGLKTETGRHFLPLNHLGQPGVLTNPQDIDVLGKHIADAQIRNESTSERQRHFPFSCRDSSCLVDIALWTERKKGNRVYLKVPTPSPPREVVHFAHAFNGGIQVDPAAESSVPNLFAAGEAAAGPHGADRIGGCMLTATQVFGARAGKNAAKRAHRISRIPDIRPIPEILRRVDQRHRPDPSIPDGVADARRIISDSLMVVRNKKDLQGCLDHLEQIRTEMEKGSPIHPGQLEDHLRLRTILVLGRLVSTAAMGNELSTGSHYREDTFHRTPSEFSRPPTPACCPA